MRRNIFILQNCLNILSKVFRSIAKQPILVNQKWILKNSKELLEHLKSPNFNHITSIKSFDFSTLYTTIPHDKLKNLLYARITLESDMDPQEFKGVIGASLISEF